MKIRSPAVNRENLHDYLAQTGSVSLSTDSHAQRIRNESLWVLRLIFVCIVLQRSQVRVLS